MSISDSSTSGMRIVTLCTGNVARSVMLGYMLSDLSDTGTHQWQVRTAGTHVIEGSAMSARTRRALEGIDGLGVHPYGRHRSHQLDVADVEWADVVLASEAAHVRFVRQHFEGAAQKTVQLAALVRDGGDVSFRHRLLAVTSEDPSSLDDVIDPAGGEQVDYDACAAHLWALAQSLSALASRGAT